MTNINAGGHHHHLHHRHRSFHHHNHHYHRHHYCHHHHHHHHNYNHPGNYTCQPSSGHSASVIVHVVDGQFYIIVLMVIFCYCLDLVFLLVFHVCRCCWSSCWGLYWTVDDARIGYTYRLSVLFELWFCFLFIIVVLELCIGHEMFCYCFDFSSSHYCSWIVLELLLLEWCKLGEGL